MFVVCVSFGAKYAGGATGIIYNNNMDDFSTPGQANAYGFAPSEANWIRAGKRPLSSMSPVIVVDRSRDSEVRLVLGASGGSKIISSLAQVSIKTLNVFNERIKLTLFSFFFILKDCHESVVYECGPEEGDRRQADTQSAESASHPTRESISRGNEFAINPKQNGFIFFFIDLVYILMKVGRGVSESGG